MSDTGKICVSAYTSNNMTRERAFNNFLYSCALMGAMYTGKKLLRNLYRYNRATNLLIGRKLLNEGPLYGGK